MSRLKRNSTMSSGISTEREPAGDAGFRAWHLFVVLSMLAATVAVMLSRHTHPVALLLVSAAVIATGVVGMALHRAVAAFLGAEEPRRPLDDRARELLEREKALVLRTIKELEFDRSMGKISEADFRDMSTRLRARAVALMQDIERAQAPAASGAPSRSDSRLIRCQTCGTNNDRDAKFCKQCGKKVDA